MKNLLVLCCLSWLFPLQIAQSIPSKAVNLGAWLVAESRMNPSPFQDIINNNLLYGNQVQFKSTKHNKYLSAENGGETGLVANRPSASGWETFRLWRIDESSFNFRVFDEHFIGLDNQGINVVAVSTTSGTTKTFRISRNNDKVRIKASNGQFLQANADSSVTADYGGSSSDWADENPSVFKMEIIKKLGGDEYQLMNGYGPDKH